MEAKNLYADMKNIRKKNARTCHAVDISAMNAEWRQATFFKVIFDFGYFSGAFPYRIHYDERLQDFKISKTKLHMIYSIIIQAATIFSLVYHILLIDSAPVPKDPTVYFQLFRRVTLLITIVFWFSTVWRKSKEWKTFAGLSCMAVTGNHRKIASRILKVVFVLDITMAFMGSIFIVGETYWNFDQLYDALLRRATSVFQFHTSRSCNNASLRIGVKFAAQDMALVFTQLLLEYCHDLNAWVLYAFLSAMAIVLWLSVQIFQDQVRQTNPSSSVHLHFICQRFDELKILANNMSSILGLTLTAWVCYITVFTALKINEMFRAVDWLTGSFLVIYYCQAVSFVVLSSDACAKLNSEMKEWLLKDEVMQHFNVVKHNAVLMDLQSNPVAIRSFGVFTITYGFIGNLLTLIISFIIIIIQFTI